MKYIIGHKSPDTDTVVSAIAYSIFKENGYKPAIPGQLNEETRFVLEKFGFEAPELLESAGENEFVLVDHNEEAQRIEGLISDKVIEVVDHHKMNFSNSKPIPIIVKPYGSTATIISEMFLRKDRDIDENLAGLLLSAILSDTVIFKSPTTTEEDRKIASVLADIAVVENIEQYGIELVKKKAQVSSKSAEEIIRTDFKDFNIKDKKIGVGQIELVETKEIEAKKNEILGKLEQICNEGNYFGIILMVSDIIKEGSYLWLAGNKEELRKAFGLDETSYLQGTLSRKKQIVPVLEKNFS